MSLTNELQGNVLKSNKELDRAANISLNSDIVAHEY